MAPGTLPTIRVTAGQLPRIVAETRRSSPAPARSSGLSPNASWTASLLDWMASAALFQRFNAKRQQWVDVDPPRAVAEALLARKGHWTLPAVTGVITTPTLRGDGTLLASEGYDATTGLYLTSGLALGAVPEPTREAAEIAITLLLDLLSEFSFVGVIDRTVALSGLLTALIRGSLPQRRCT